MFVGIDSPSVKALEKIKFGFWVTRVFQNLEVYAMATEEKLQGFIKSPLLGSLPRQIDALQDLRSLSVFRCFRLFLIWPFEYLIGHGLSLTSQTTPLSEGKYLVRMS